MAGLYRRAADGKRGGPEFNIFRTLDSFMQMCRRSPVLNKLVRRPLSFLWFASMGIYFALRNRLRSPICTLRVHGFRFSVDLRDSVIARHGVSPPQFAQDRKSANAGVEDADPHGAVLTCLARGVKLQGVCR